MTCPPGLGIVLSVMNNQVHTTDNQLHDLIQVSPEESRPYDGWAGFPGCGDGQDDFADYNAGEGQDW